MTKEEIIKEMYHCFDAADFTCFEEQVNNYLEICDEKIASEDLATFLLTEYTSAKSDFIAQLMEVVIRCNPNLALINFPENHFFKIAMVSGSMDLFDCYIVDVVEPHLENASEEECKEYYNELLKLGVKMNRLFSDQYQLKIKGFDFNGAFTVNPDTGIASIHKEDFDIMDDIVNRYNTIVVR